MKKLMETMKKHYVMILIAIGISITNWSIGVMILVLYALYIQTKKKVNAAIEGYIKELKDNK